jgi:hypothetical protein
MMTGKRMKLESLLWLFKASSTPFNYVANLRSQDDPQILDDDPQVFWSFFCDLPSMYGAVPGTLHRV